MTPKETPTCKIIYSPVGFFFRDEDDTFLGDHKLDFVTNKLLNALEEMSVYYDDLDYVGYYDEKLGAFIITKVINNYDGSELSQKEIDEMMYIAPEYVHEIIKILDQETGIVMGVEL